MCGRSLPLPLLVLIAFVACRRPAKIDGSWADVESNGRARLLRFEKVGTFEAHVVGVGDAHIDNGKYVLSSDGGKTLVIRTFESRHNTAQDGRRLMTVDTMFASLSEAGDVLAIYDRCDFGNEKAPLSLKRVGDELMVPLAQYAREAVLVEARAQASLEYGALGAMFRRKPGRNC